MLTEKFDAALAYASTLHRSQSRKGTAVPYISHLLAVCSLVLEHGGDEEQAIAALLHDAVEDQGGLETSREIAERFGSGVSQLVLACTDALPAVGEEKLPWEERKFAFIERIPKLPARAHLVIACDKLHNLACLIADLQRDGRATLSRFSQPARLGWYYTTLANALAPHLAQAPSNRLLSRAEDFQSLAAGVLHRNRTAD